MAFFGKVHALQTWDNPAATTLTISVYYVALYFRMLLPATFLTLLSLVMWEYLKANGFVTTEAKEEADEKDAGTLRDKMTYVAGVSFGRLRSLILAADCPKSAKYSGEAR